MMDFKKLSVWEKSHKLVLDIYKNTKSFPSYEMYGFTSQIRRAFVSIPNNIAEGCGRNSETELNRFLTISMGSTSEVEYLLILSKDLNYLNQSQYEILNNKIVEIKKMLSAYSAKIRQSII